MGFVGFEEDDDFTVILLRYYVVEVLGFTAGHVLYVDITTVIWTAGR